MGEADILLCPEQLPKIGVPLPLLHDGVQHPVHSRLDLGADETAVVHRPHLRPLAGLGLGLEDDVLVLPFPQLLQMALQHQRQRQPVFLPQHHLEMVGAEAEAVGLDPDMMYSTQRFSSVSRSRQIGQPHFGSKTSLTGMV